MNQAPIRILIVDDSAVTRMLLSDALAGDPGLEVVGTASDGRAARAAIPLLKPDLVTLDIEMPAMDGLETLAVLRKLYPKLPVIVLSTLTERGAAATIKALALGAADYATTPSTIDTPEVATERIRNHLIPKIKALCGLGRMKPLPLSGSRPALKDRVRFNQSIEIVAIGTSTGGPDALAEVLSWIPSDFPVPIVVVQHMPPVFTRQLAERLANSSAIPVEEGRAGVIISPGRAWIAPGDFHMKVIRADVGWQLNLSHGPPENSCRPAVDVLFRSVAQAYGAGVLGVVMTGMGADGVRGAQDIRDACGEVIIQDEASSVVWGMAGMVHASGLDDAAYPLDRLGPEITRRVQESRGSSSQFELKSYATAGPK